MAILATFGPRVLPPTAVSTRHTGRAATSLALGGAEEAAIVTAVVEEADKTTKISLLAKVELLARNGNGHYLSNRRQSPSA